MPASVDHYWNPAADANWGDANVWAATDGGTANLSAPLSSDNVFFTATNSHKCTISATANCLNLYFDNADNGGHGDYVGNFVGGAALNVYGSLIVSSGMTFGTGSTTLTFKSTSTGNMVDTAGKSTYWTYVFNGVGGAWQLQNDLTSTNSLQLTNGSLDTNGKTVTVSFVQNTGSGTTTLILGNSLIVVSYFGGSGWRFSNTTGLTFNANNSTIKVMAGATFDGGGLTYNNFWFHTTSSIGVTITGSNTFNDFKDDGTAAHTIIFPNSTTIVATFSVNGTAGNLISLTRTGASGNWTLSAPSGTISCNYIQPSNGITTGGATFNAYTANGCVDGGGNTGWNFSAPIVLSGGAFLFNMI